MKDKQTLREKDASDRWRSAISLAVTTFLLSILFTGPTAAVLTKVNVSAGLTILLVIIVIAVLSDIVAIAATAANEPPFHAMSANRLPGSREAIALVRNSNRVNSLCADVVGDISGTVNGLVGGTLIIQINLMLPPTLHNYITMLTIGLIAAATVGSKAYTKGFAIKNSTSIIRLTGLVLYNARQVFAPLIRLTRLFRRQKQ